MEVYEKTKHMLFLHILSDKKKLKYVFHKNQPQLKKHIIRCVHI